MHAKDSAAKLLSSWWVTLLVAFVAGFAPTSISHAQQFELNQFDPTLLGTDGFVVNTADDLGHKRFGLQVYIEYADDPLVFENDVGATGSESIQVVHRELTGHLQLSAGFWDRLVVSLGLPYYFILKEETDGFGPGSPAEAALINGLRPNGTGIGDLSVAARVRLYGKRDDLFQIAIQGAANIHTATLADSKQFYRGESGVGGEIEVPFTFNVIEILRFSGNLGVRFRPSEQLLSDPDAGGVRQPLNLSLGHEFTYGVGMIAELLDKQLSVIAEFYGRLGLSERTGSSGFAKREESPAEVLAGVKYFHRTGFTAGAGGGMGIQRGYGSPDFRVFAMIGFTMPEEKPPVDSDGDGLFDHEDECPHEPEDKDGFEDENGCPDPDNDQDTVLDVDDRCPIEPGVPENEGCPDPDRDGDTVPDRIDNCPDEPGDPERQGCKAKQLVEIKGDRLDILQRVYFRTNSDRILPRSYRLLNNVASVIVAHPEITRVRVEGHTDARGSASYNKKLSQRRAQSVVRYLTKRSVATDRLEARGFGEERLIISDATTKEEHARNRRVEFNIGDAEGIEQGDSGPTEEEIDR